MISYTNFSPNQMPLVVVIGNQAKQNNKFDDITYVESQGGFKKIQAIRMYYSEKKIIGIQMTYELRNGKSVKTSHNPRKDSILGFVVGSITGGKVQTKIFQIKNGDYLCQIQAGWDNEYLLFISFETYKGQKCIFGVPRNEFVTYKNPGFTFGPVRGSYYQKKLNYLIFPVTTIPEKIQIPQQIPNLHNTPLNNNFIINNTNNMQYQFQNNQTQINIQNNSNSSQTKIQIQGATLIPNRPISMNNNNNPINNNNYVFAKSVPHQSPKKTQPIQIPNMIYNQNNYPNQNNYLNQNNYPNQNNYISQNNNQNNNQNSNQNTKQNNNNPYVMNDTEYQKNQSKKEASKIPSMDYPDF